MYYLPPKFICLILSQRKVRELLLDIVEAQSSNSNEYSSQSQEAATSDSLRRLLVDQSFIPQQAIDIVITNGRNLLFDSLLNYLRFSPTALGKLRLLNQISKNNLDPIDDLK